MKTGSMKRHQQNIRYTLSPHVLALQFGYVTVLFHSQTLKRVYGAMAFRAFMEPFLGISGASMNEGIEPFSAGCDPNILFDEQFLIPASGESLEIEPCPGESVAPHRLHLLLSRQCHGECRDCSSSPMTSDDACAVLDIFFALQNPSSPAPSIILDGLFRAMDSSLLFRIIPYIREKECILYGGGVADIELRTGALPVNSELAGLLKDHGIRVKIFFQGTDEDYYSQPRFMNRGASYRETVLSYRSLQKKGLEPEILCLVDLSTIHRLSEIGRFFTIDLECRRLHFMPRYYPDDASVPALLFAERLIELFGFLRSYGIYEERVMSRLLPFVKEEPIPLRGRAGGHIVVSPDGTLYCGTHRGTMKPALSVNSDVEINREAICSILGGSDDGPMGSASIPCMTCMCRSLCGGEGNLSSMAPCPLMPHVHRHCLETTAMLHWFLRDLAEGIDLPAGEGSLIMNCSGGE
jgi:sulfatase maturation enzyme AslB (radical SAM superfamily)